MSRTAPPLLTSLAGRRGAGPSGGPPSAGVDTDATLRRLELLVTRRLDGMLAGSHLGLLPGAGSEPAETREYAIGDDVRRMDWSVTARTTVPHVRDLIADRELESWVLADMSASQEFGTSTCEKRDLVLAATAAVGYLTSRVGNRFGAVVIGEALPAGGRLIPARSGRAHLHTALRTLANTPRSGLSTPGPQVERPATDLAAALGRLRRPQRRRGLCVVISDFLGGTPPSGNAAPGWERELRALAARHQVLAIEVLDPRELSLPDVGVLRLVDPETGRLLDVNTRSKALRERYAAAAIEQRAQIAASLRRAGASHLQLRTDRDWLVDIVRHVAASRRRRG